MVFKKGTKGVNPFAASNNASSKKDAKMSPMSAVLKKKMDSAKSAKSGKGKGKAANC